MVRRTNQGLARVSSGGGGITITESPTNPGAVGAGNLWFNNAASTESIYPLFVRDPTNTFWTQASIGDTVIGTGAQTAFFVFDIDSNTIVKAQFNPSGSGIALEINSDLGNAPRSELRLLPDSAALSNNDGVNLASVIIDSGIIAMTATDIQCNASTLYTQAAAAPTVFTSLFYRDTTAVTGRMYMWDFVTAAYVPISGAF